MRELRPHPPVRRVATSAVRELRPVERRARRADALDVEREAQLARRFRASARGRLRPARLRLAAGRRGVAELLTAGLVVAELQPPAPKNPTQTLNRCNNTIEECVTKMEELDRASAEAQATIETSTALQQQLAIDRLKAEEEAADAQKGTCERGLRGHTAGGQLRELAATLRLGEECDSAPRAAVKSRNLGTIVRTRTPSRLNP